VAATAADFPSGKAEPTLLGRDPMRRRLSRQEADLNAANAAAPQGEAQERRVQRRMRGNLPGPEGLARHFARAQPLYLAVPADPCAGASAALHGLSIVSTMDRAARLASAPVHRSNGAGQAQLHRTDIRPCQRGSRRILRQAPERIAKIRDRRPDRAGNIRVMLGCPQIVGDFELRAFLRRPRLQMLKGWRPGYRWPSETTT